MTGDQQLVNIYCVDGGRPYRGQFTFRDMEAALDAANAVGSARYTHIKTVPLSEWERETSETRRETSI